MKSKVQHLNAQVISRKDSKSTLSVVAYQTGEKLVDERQKKTFYYGNRSRVISDGVILPDGGTADRQSIWNKVEHANKKQASVVGYKLVIAIPNDLEKKDRIELVKQFAQTVSDHYGVAVDYAVHQDNDHDNNPHAHMVLSSVSCDRGGEVGKKVYELDPIYCKRNGLQTSMEILRPEFTRQANELMEKKGIEVRMEHRSFDELGIDRIPQIHEGHGAFALARKCINAQICFTNQIRENRRKVATQENKMPEQKKKTFEEVLTEILESIKTNPTPDNIKAQLALCKQVKTSYMDMLKKDSLRQLETDLPIYQKQYELTQIEEKKFLESDPEPIRPTSGMFLSKRLDKYLEEHREWKKRLDPYIMKRGKAHDTQTTCSYYLKNIDTYTQKRFEFSDETRACYNLFTKIEYTARKMKPPSLERESGWER